jgi:tetratricopeptide (TPR) repeat protein
VRNQLGLYDDAITYLDDALALGQDNPYTFANIAQSFLKIGAVEQAHRHINRSLTNDNTNPYANRIKGDCYKASGEYEHACKEYKKALKNGYSLLYS